MPKLNDTHIVERLKKRIQQLEAGEELEAKDIKSLLSATQFKALEDAWVFQKKLRDAKKTRIEAEKKLLGWKTRRELRIDALKQALTDKEENLTSIFRGLQRQAEIRQARIYFEALKQAEAEGKTGIQAKNWANNELTRAGLSRLDGRRSSAMQSKRDKEVFELEREIKGRRAPVRKK